MATIDVIWDEDLDLLGRDTYDEEQILFQDVAHRTLEIRGSNIRYPDEGVGIEQYLSTATGLSAVAQMIEADLVTDSRIKKISAKAQEDGRIEITINEKWSLTANPDGSVTWDIPAEGGQS